MGKQVKKIKTIYPKVEGNYLTQSVLEDENARMFARCVSGANVNEEDWRDATPEEKEQWEREHQPEEPTE